MRLFKITEFIGALTLFSVLIYSGTTTTAHAEQQSSKIFAQVDSTFEASIPKQIDLMIHSNADGTGIAEYTTYAKGDSEGDMSIYIIPDTIFTLTEINTGETIEVSITQSKTEWTAEDLVSSIYVKGHGYVLVTGLKPGQWTGTFDFEIVKEESSLSKYIPGLYSDAGYTNLIMSWNDLISSGKITITNGTVKSNDATLDGYLAVGTEVTSVAQVGFAAHINLDGIYLPDTVLTVGNQAFVSCEQLSTVRLSQKLTTIELGAFAFCPSLTELVLPDSLTTIGQQAIYGSSIKQIMIPANVTTIDLLALSSTQCLESIVVSSENPKYDSIDGVLYTEGYETLVSYPCSKTTDMYTVMTGTKTIETYAFNSTTDLKRVVFPDSVTMFNQHSMRNTSVEYFNLPVKASIYKDYWPDLLAESYAIKHIEVDKNHSNYTSVDGIVYSKDMGTILCYPCARPEDTFTVPDSVTLVGKGSFAHTTHLKTLTLQEGVTKIDAFMVSESGIETLYIPSTCRWYVEYALADCPNLTNIIFPNGHPSWYIKNGGLYSQANNLLTHIHGLPDTTFTTNSSCTRIAGGAFRGSENLISVTITDNVKTLGEELFEGNPNLGTVVLPSNITTIPYAMFYNLPKLTNVEIPSTVTSIDAYAFYRCTSLDLTIPNSVTSISSNALYKVPHITYHGSASGSPWGALSKN